MTIDVSDVQNMVKIIDTVSVRGAFRGEELATVGQFREKLVEVLKAAAEEETKSNTDED